MSHEAEGRGRADRGSQEPSTRDGSGVENGIEALRDSPEFRGPVEPVDGHDDRFDCQHLALFYETQAEKFDAVVPFLRQGIERGERVLYVVDRESEDELKRALRDGNVDVETAIDRDQLTFTTVEDTYLRGGAFDADRMIEFYGKVIEETVQEWPALRVTADTKWIREDDVSVEEFTDYESRINDLFEGEECIALCHYDRTEISADVLANVVRTHPHLIYDNAVCHNVYYTPPAEFFEPNEPAREVERMLGTLTDLTKARVALDDTIDELEESNQRLRRFAYIASHDLQEPLRMISSYLQLLETEYGDELDEDAEEYVGYAVDGADRMREMVEGLLSYSRIDMHDDGFEPVDCEEVIEDVLADQQLRIEETDAHVEVESMPTVRGDRQQLAQVFDNLVSNALKYSGEEPPVVRIGAERRGDRWVLSVADEGIGIDPAYTDQIFEVFNRLHSDDEYPGTGIGLALCRKIVAHHGGDIWVESEPGNGTTFSLTLPNAHRPGH